MSEESEAEILREFQRPVEPPPAPRWTDDPWNKRFYDRFEQIFAEFLQYLAVPNDENGNRPRPDLIIRWNENTHRIEYYARKVLFVHWRHPYDLIRIEPFHIFGWYGPKRAFSMLDLAEYLENPV